MVSNKIIFRPNAPVGVKAAFLDRDGVINIDHAYVSRRENFDFVPGVLEGARDLVKKGFILVVTTNQSGIGRGKYDKTEFERLTFWMAGKFAAAGAPLSAVYFCPHHPTSAKGEYLQNCSCRKPEPGMILSAAGDLGIDLSHSLFIGDKKSDMLAALRAGIPTRILVSTDGSGKFSETTDSTQTFNTLLDAVSHL